MNYQIKYVIPGGDKSHEENGSWGRAGFQLQFVKSLDVVTASLQ